MLSIFSRYATIGVLNTGLHWVVFFTGYYLLGLTQAMSNLGAFGIAVTFSFVMNAKFTFKQKSTGKKYIAYVVFMGAVSAAVGAMSDMLRVAPLVTLIFFSLISLILGFLYSRFFVFR